MQCLSKLREKLLPHIRVKLQPKPVKSVSKIRIDQYWSDKIKSLHGFGAELCSYELLYAIESGSLETDPRPKIARIYSNLQQIKNADRYCNLNRRM